MKNENIESCLIDVKHIERIKSLARIVRMTVTDIHGK